MSSKKVFWLTKGVGYLYISQWIVRNQEEQHLLPIFLLLQSEALQPLRTVSNHPHHLGPVSLPKFICWNCSIVLQFVIFTNKVCRLEKCGCFPPTCSLIFPIKSFFFFFSFTNWGSVRLEQVSQLAFLDGGIPTQGLVVQDEQEAVELHQELVQHCKRAQIKRCQLWKNYFNPEWLLYDFTLWPVVLKHRLLMKRVSRLLLEEQRRAIRSLWSSQTEKIKPRHSLVFKRQICSVCQTLTRDRV